MEFISKIRILLLVKLFWGHKPISIKWIFRIKETQDKHTKYKACMVVWRCEQKTKIAYNNMFSPMAKWTTIKLVTTIVVVQGWEFHHMDVKLTFLNGKIKQELYIQQPLGFVIQGQKWLVYKFNKALYGLKQAPK